MVELHNPDLVFVHFNCSPPTVCTSDRNPLMKIPPPIAFFGFEADQSGGASVAVCGAVCPPRRAGPRPACGRAAAAPVSSNQRPTVHHQLQCQWRAAPSTNKWDQCTLAPGLSPAAGAHTTSNKALSAVTQINMLFCNDGLNHNLTSILLERTNLSIKY